MTSCNAHSANKVQQWHRLADHLSSVSRLTKCFLKGWRGTEEGELAGLLHDLGKYGDRFQERLRGKDSGLDHWSQGAWLALTKYQSLAAALAVQGHHIGLQSLQEMKNADPGKLAVRHPLNLSLSDPVCERLEARLAQDGLSLAKPSQPLFTRMPIARVDEMLDVRRVFSALVDADFLDTEAHFNGDHAGKVYRDSGPPLQAARALRILTDHLQKLEQDAQSSASMRVLRSDLKQVCLDSAAVGVGLFTLTAPTGSGKTLAMLAFALRHAEIHELDRIIVVIPYLSIIEQTAKIYRDLFEPHFGPEYVLEHHSLAGIGTEPSREDADNPTDESRRKQRLLSQNWDTPLIVTTSVQMLESLFSNRPSACRKLHRIAKSVILFDEVQTLPVKLAVATLAALSHVAAEWGSSVVFSTATQPAFEHLHEAVQRHAALGWKPDEIARAISRPGNTNRVSFDWSLTESPISWDSVAQQLLGERQVLCIVNMKKHAKLLWEKLEGLDGLYHLSTSMCPLHRQNVLAAVGLRLKENQPCRLVATQCVEAGVDIDFPLVWRAFAPLDAIIQAAGRCNREDKLPRAGITRVFLPEANGNEWIYPDHGYRQAANVTESLLNERGRNNFEPHDPTVLGDYYRKLYAISRPENQSPKLLAAIGAFDFVTTAIEYRLIKQDAINVLSPWPGAIDGFKKLETRASSEGLTSGWIRTARGLSVSLYRPKQDDPTWDALLPVTRFRKGRASTSDDWFIYARPEHYHEALGLSPPQSLNVWIA